MFAPLLARTTWLHGGATSNGAISNDKDETKIADIHVGLCLIGGEARTPELLSAIRTCPAFTGGIVIVMADVSVSSALQLPAAALALSKAGAVVVIAVYPWSVGKLVPSLLTTMSAAIGLPIVQVQLCQDEYLSRPHMNTPRLFQTACM
jgi:hypothetical protein